MSQRKLITREQLQHHISRGVKTSVIADLYRCTPQTVNYHMRVYGLTRPENTSAARGMSGGGIKEPEQVECNLKLGYKIKISNRQGKVTEIYKLLFLVDFGLYKESFMFADYNYKIDTFKS